MAPPPLCPTRRCLSLCMLWQNVFLVYMCMSSHTHGTSPMSFWLLIVVAICGHLKEIGPQEARPCGHSALCSCASFPHCKAGIQDTHPLKSPQLLLTTQKPGKDAYLHSTGRHLPEMAYRYVWGGTLPCPSKQNRDCS